MTTKYSIFLPVHNGSGYLKKCVESILGQEYPYFTLEILENQSTDGSREWLESLTDSRIRLWPSERLLTIEENWHRILTLPKNEFMTIIGHDDLLDAGFLTEIEDLLEHHREASLFLTHFRLIDSEGKFSKDCKPVPRIEYAHEFLASRFMWLRDSFGTGYVMRARDYEEAGGIPSYHKLLFADDALWYLISRKSHKVTSPRCLFSYRYHEGSISGNVAPGDILKALSSYKDLLLREAAMDPYLKNVVEKYLPHFLKFFFRIELDISRKSGTDGYDGMVQAIQSVYSEFRFEFPFAEEYGRNERERGIRFRTKRFLKWVLPGGVTEFVRIRRA